MKRLFLLIFCCFSAFLYAQTGSQANPFELEWRMEKVDTSGAIKSLSPRNPFDVVAHRPPAATDKPKTVQGGKKSGLGLWFKSLAKRGGESKNLIFGLAIAILTLTSLTIGLGRGVVEKAWNAFINNNQFILLFREWQNRQLLPSFLLLYANFILNLSVFMFLAVRFLNDNKIGGFQLWFLCLLLALAIYLTKHLVIWLCGKIYPVENEANQYSFLMSSANGTIGIFLIPFNLLIGFVESLQGFLIFWIVSLFVIFYILRSIRALAFSSKLIFGSSFHFLLYLCAVELLPICVLLKMAWQNLV